MYIKVFDIMWNFGELANSITPPELPEEMEIRDRNLIMLFFKNEIMKDEIEYKVSEYLHKTKRFCPKDFGFDLEPEIGDNVYVYDLVLEDKSKVNNEEYTENNGTIVDFTYYGVKIKLNDGKIIYLEGNDAYGLDYDDLPFELLPF